MKFELTVTSMISLDEFDKEKLGFKKDEDGNFIPYLHGDFEPAIIEINTLEELIEFSKKYGQLVFDAQTNEIEIYNNYRE